MLVTQAGKHTPRLGEKEGFEIEELVTALNEALGSTARLRRDKVCTTPCRTDILAIVFLCSYWWRW